MSLEQNQNNESKEGDQQFINEDEEKKDEYSTPQIPPSENQNQRQSRSHSQSHININNTSHLNSSSSSLPTHVRSISDQSISIQPNIHKYPNVSQFSATSSSPHSTAPPRFLASKSLSHLNQPPHSHSLQPNQQKSKPLQSSSNIQRRYFNKSKYYQYITTEIQLITTIIHQHLTISNANNASSSISSSSNPANSRYNMQSKSSLLHSGPSSSQSLNGSAASYTLKQWQINNFFQNLLKQFEYTRFSMSFNDSLVLSYIDIFSLIECKDNNNIF